MKIKSILRMLSAIGLSAIVVGLFSFRGASATVPGVNQAVDISTSGGVPSAFNGGPPGDSVAMSMSQSGRYIAFTSGATNISTSGYNGSKSQVYVRDRLANTTELISKDSSGNAANWTTQQPSISGSGRYVAYVSGASNLVSPSINNGGFVYNHVYRYDRQTGTTQVVDKDASGNFEYFYRSATKPSISADGNYVAFQYASTGTGNLITSPALSTGTSYIFLKNMTTGAVTLISAGTGNTAPNANSTTPFIDCSGSKIAYNSTASNIVSGGSSGTGGDVYLYNVLNGSNTNLTLSANGASAANSMSCSGQYIGIASSASNLGGATTSNGVGNTFRYSIVDNEFKLLSQSSSGTQSSVSTSQPTISDDGKYGIFQCAGNCGLVSGTIGSSHIYLRSIEAGTTQMIDVASGTPANADSQNPTMSGDGRYVAYTSLAQNLISGYYFYYNGNYWNLYYVSQTGSGADY